MKMNDSMNSVTFKSYDNLFGNENKSLNVRYSNTGDPYTEGIEISLTEPDEGKGYRETSFSMYIEGYELEKLRNLLNELHE